MSSDAMLPAEAKSSHAAAQLVEVLQEIADGLISADEGAARLGCSGADLAHLASVPEIERAFLAVSAQSKRDGQAIRRRALALLLRLLTRMSDSVDRLDDEGVPRAVDTVTRVLTAIDKTASEREVRPTTKAPRLVFTLQNDDRSKLLTIWLGGPGYDNAKHDEAMEWFKRPSSEEPDPQPTPEHPARVELFRPDEMETIDVDGSL